MLKFNFTSSLHAYCLSSVSLFFTYLGGIKFLACIQTTDPILFTYIILFIHNCTITQKDNILLMGALCNFTPYLYYCALISFLQVCMFTSFFIDLFSTTTLSMQFYFGSYTIRIASLQGNHGYFSHKLKNKTKTG